MAATAVLGPLCSAHGLEAPKGGWAPGHRVHTERCNLPFVLHFVRSIALTGA